MKPRAKFSTADNLRSCSLIVKKLHSPSPAASEWVWTCTFPLRFKPKKNQSLAPVDIVAVVSKHARSEAHVNVCLTPPWLVHPDGQPRGSNSVLVQCRPLPPPHAGLWPAIVHLHLCVSFSFITTSQPNLHLLNSLPLKPRPESDRVSATGEQKRRKSLWCIRRFGSLICLL